MSHNNGLGRQILFYTAAKATKIIRNKTTGY